MLKRTQKEASEASLNWYQDKYQHVLTQRNVLALIALIALIAALFAVFAVMKLAPLKSVEPYLLQIDEKSGVTQKVNPITRKEYAANEAVDRYFISAYMRAREGYNPAVLKTDYQTVRLMSASDVFRAYRRQVDPGVEGSLASRLTSFGRRDIKINSMAYISNPVEPGKKAQPESFKIMQVRVSTMDFLPDKEAVEQQWIVTIKFEYANLAINDSEQLVNPLGFQVLSYQVQREIN